MLRVSENELEQFAQSCVLSWKSVCLPTLSWQLWPPKNHNINLIHKLCYSIYLTMCIYVILVGGTFVTWPTRITIPRLNTWNAHDAFRHFKLKNILPQSPYECHYQPHQWGCHFPTFAHPRLVFIDNTKSACNGVITHQWSQFRFFKYSNLLNHSLLYKYIVDSLNV